MGFDPTNLYRPSLLREEITGLTDLLVTPLVKTHEHFDDIGGSEVFLQVDVVAHENISMVFNQSSSGPETGHVDVICVVR